MRSLNSIKKQNDRAVLRHHEFNKERWEAYLAKFQSTKKEDTKKYRHSSQGEK